MVLQLKRIKIQYVNCIFSNDNYEFNINFNFENECFIYDLKIFQKNKNYLDVSEISQKIMSYSERILH